MATYITTIKGKKLSVVLSLGDYKKLLEAKEELDDIRLYDAVKSKNEPLVSLEQYLSERKTKRKTRV